MLVQHAFNHMTWPLATHDGADHRIAADSAFLKGRGGGFKIQGDSRRQQFDVADFLGRRIQQHIAIFRRATRAPGLEKILQANANFTFDAANRLLKLPREDRIGSCYFHWILKPLVKIVHRSLRC